MSRFVVRTLCSKNFVALRQLEADVFNAAGNDVLCPHYLRLCTEFYGDTCFLALVDGRAVGYLLCFVRDRDAYCSSGCRHIRARPTDVALTGSALRPPSARGPH